MSSPSSKTRQRRASKTGLLISAAFHLITVGFLVWMAAREGLLGLPLKKITVNLIREPAPVAPPALDKPGLAPPEIKPPSLPEPAPPPSPPPTREEVSVPPTPSPPPMVAPAPVIMPSFAFDDGGKAVQTLNDAAGLYRSFVEFSLRARWNRPTGLADEHYVAEIEIAVDPTGRVTDPRWKRRSGDARWDASVLDALFQTRTLDRPPPPEFPSRMTLRFDVVPSEAPLAP